MIADKTFRLTISDNNENKFLYFWKFIWYLCLLKYPRNSQNNIEGKYEIKNVSCSFTRIVSLKLQRSKKKDEEKNERKRNTSIVIECAREEAITMKNCYY